MVEHFYSTQPFLAWCLNHFFYGRRHYAFVGAPFHPYRLVNPNSSNPWKMYGAQYEPWIDRDPYDAVVQQKRITIRKGVIANASLLTIPERNAIDAICGKVDLTFLVPLVYRVDTSAISTSRKAVRGSGSLGSNEYLIQDLGEHEFDILFFDAGSDPRLSDPDLLVLASYLLDGSDKVSRREALRILWSRRTP
ncbi:MAG: hypothetical protein ACJ74O_13365 [Frankiaceae bacterium]